MHRYSMSCTWHCVLLLLLSCGHDDRPPHHSKLRGRCIIPSSAVSALYWNDTGGQHVRAAAGIIPANEAVMLTVAPLSAAFHCAPAGFCRQVPQQQSCKNACMGLHVFIMLSSNDQVGPTTHARYFHLLQHSTAHHTTPHHTTAQRPWDMSDHGQGKPCFQEKIPIFESMSQI